jgi:O-acetyl-ADP-ribose deacetylase (regulator of RNase III)/NAD-dependent SIR2 family protein deacetylase
MALVVSDREVIRNILQERERYAAYVGAGVSIEADVMGADRICGDIRADVLKIAEDRDEAAVNAELMWNDPKRRYSSCLKKYGNAAQRVEYFRRLLKGKEPCFAHHALSLLAARRVLRTTCLTTNFDKLLELAFARQGEVECQAIRTSEEAAYWGGEPDKCYVLKLHGDYDTHNILNTRDETLEIEEELVSITEDLLQDGGLIVLGTAGNEDSVLRLFDRLTSKKAARKLSMGVFWGVYVGPLRPPKILDVELKRLVGEAIEKGSVSKEAVEMMNRANTDDRTCAFFPVWGSGSFLFSLISASGDRSLAGTAERYLDHDMRLRHVFGRAGLKPLSVEAHLKALDEQRRRIQALAVDIERAWTARRKAPQTVVRVLYGDITRRSVMSDPEFADVRRAIVSPDDTCISAGGGVAYEILKKAGANVMLNELGKLGPIPQRTVAVTSGGNLPLQYVIHTAAMSIGTDATYSVTAEDVEETIGAALRMAAALHVEMLLIPLVGAGVGPLTPAESLKAILRAIVSQPDIGQPLTIQIVIYQERQLARNEIGDSLRSMLGASFEVRPEAP